MRPIVGCAAAVLVALLASACEPDVEPGSGDPAPRDSAGIEIIEYSREALEAAPLLTVSDTFDLSIGAAEEPAAEVFGRISAATEFADGTIAVVDGQTLEIRYFTADGEFVRSVGRRGEGPEEFQGPDGWWLVGDDTLKIWDRRAGRLVSLSDGGSERSALSFGSPAGPPDYYVGSYDDGSALFWLSGGRASEDGRLFSFEGLVRMSPESATSEPVMDTVFWREWERPRESEGGGVMLWRARTSGGIHPQGGWIAPGDVPELHLYDLEGRLVRIVRWEQDDPTITPEHIERYIESRLENVPPERRAERRRSLEEQPKAEQFPAVRGVRSRMDGTAWLLPYPRPDREDLAEWMVFSPEGELRARIRGLAPMEPLPPTLESVLVAETDDVGVPVLRRYRLVPVGG